MRAQSLAFKLSLAFMFVSLAGIAMVALIARESTATQFGEYQYTHAQQEVIERLEDYYLSNGSWQGIRQRFLPRAQNPENRPNLLPDQLTPRRAIAFLNNRRARLPIDFALIDTSGEVLVPGIGLQPGDILDKERTERGVAIKIDDQIVGIYLDLRILDNAQPEIESDDQFLANVNRSLALGAVGAVGVSIILGVFLARSLTHPLKELTSATRRIGTGDLGQHVRVHSKDEIGELANAFNEMHTRLAKSIELRRQMTADIAHDLRTPLSVILGHTEGLSDGVLPPTREAFDLIHDEAQRLNRLIDDLRTLTLTETGELTLSLKSISPDTLLRRISTAHTPTAKHNNVSLNLTIQPGLSPLQIDPDRMTQVLDNLVSNALRYVEPGGRIQLAARQNNGHIRLTIADNGRGIPADDLPYIFERFYRADKTRRRHKGGSGLGLAIAKNIVQAHDGHIRVESIPGKGTAFHIDLPVSS